MFKRLLHTLFVLYSYVEFVVLLALFIPIAAVIRLIHRHDPTMRVPGRAMRYFGRTMTALSPLWRFSVSGTPPADIKQKPYVVISNHESVADPFLLAWLPWDQRWVAKEELFHIPVIGHALRLCGDLRVRRGDGESVRELMAQCRATLAAGLSVMLFPEGSRSKDGTLLPFKDGAFELAILAGVPLLPVVVVGTRQCLAKHSMWFGKSRAQARILAPISTSGMTPDDVPALRERARAVITEALADLRQELGVDLPVAKSPLSASDAAKPVRPQAMRPERVLPTRPIKGAA